MARFRGTVHGQRGSASRLGNSKTGLAVTANGWESGVEVAIEASGENDLFLVELNGGSNNKTAIVRFGDFVSLRGSWTVDPEKFSLAVQKLTGCSDAVRKMIYDDAKARNLKLSQVSA